MSTSSLSRDLADRASSNIPVGAAGSTFSGVPSPRRRFPRVSASPRCPATIPEHPDEELWIDGPRSSVCLAAAAEPASQVQSGRSRKFAQDSASAFLSQNATQSAVNSELWVDGPVEFQTRLPSSRTVDDAGPTAIARKPVINNDVEQTVTSSRQSRRSAVAPHGDGASTSGLPRSSANKSHSSPRLRHPTQQERDGRITEWVRSVQQASQPRDADVHQSDTVNVSEPRELQLTEPGDHENRGNVEVPEREDTSSVSNGSQSVYERQVDDSLECAVLSSSAVVSSDEDAASVSNCKVDQLRDAVPDGRANDSERRCMATNGNIPLPNNPEDVSVQSGGRSRLLEPVVRSASNSSRHGSVSPSRRSSPFPRRCFSSPRKNSSSYGSQSSEPSRLNLPSRSRTSTPTTGRRCSDTGRERSKPSAVKKPPRSVAEQVTNVSSQKSQKTASPNLQASKGTGLRNVGVGLSSPRTAKVERRSCVPVAVKKSSEADDGRRLVSPYHTVTSPRRGRAGCSTSSDNSSLLSDAVTARSKSSELELSSGYESMLRDDSEDTITAHCCDDDHTRPLGQC